MELLEALQRKERVYLSLTQDTLRDVFAESGAQLEAVPGATSDQPQVGRLRVPVVPLNLCGSLNVVSDRNYTLVSYERRRSIPHHK